VVDYGPEWPPFKETGNSRETAAVGQFPTSFFLEVNNIKKKEILRIFILFITITQLFFCGKLAAALCLQGFQRFERVSVRRGLTVRCLRTSWG
jgi:hypothetical protein